MIIAFMGNDGSGKTTVIKLIKDKLENSGREVVSVPGLDHFFLDRFKLWLQRLCRIDIGRLQEEYSDRGRKKARSIFYLWPYLVFLDCVCLWLKYAFPTKKTVIFDRYFYDYVISFQDLGNFSSAEEFLFLLLPKPRNSFILDVSAEVAYERKKETHSGSLDYYEKQRLRYLWLASRKNIPVINTDQDRPKEIAQRIFEQLK